MFLLEPPYRDFVEALLGIKKHGPYKGHMKEPVK